MMNDAKKTEIREGRSERCLLSRKSDTHTILERRVYVLLRRAIDVLELAKLGASQRSSVHELKLRQVV